MEVGHKTFRCNRNDVMYFYFIGDIHEGNCNFQAKALKKAVNIIKETPNSYVFGMGDYIEGITINDKKRFDPITIAKQYNIRDLKDLPYIQALNVYKKLKPIEDKFLALLIGNHEEAYVKYNHSDVYDRFTGFFTSKPIKLGYVGLFKLGFIYDENRNRPNFTLLLDLNHGNGGAGFREGYPLNKVHDTFRWTVADVCVMGHIHKMTADRQLLRDMTQKNKFKSKVRWYGSTGCFLKTYVEGNTNYFEHKGRSDSDIGMLRLKVEVNRNYKFKLERIFIDEDE